MRMANKIKQLIDDRETNPHQVSQKAGLTYRIVLSLYNAEYIKGTTPIDTLQRVADVLGVSVGDLYEPERSPEAA